MNEEIEGRSEGRRWKRRQENEEIGLEEDEKEKREERSWRLKRRV